MLASELFNTPDSLIRLDMSEFMEKHSVSRMIGSPPGYVGYEDGGGLTEKIRMTPYSVVLFDEIEKAHPDIFNLFLQILDDGILTDARGTRAVFKNAVIIMTSNIGAEFLEHTKFTGFNADFDKESEKNIDRNAVMNALKSHFRPEFLGRIDEIAIFEHLNSESIRKITDKMLFETASRIEKLGVDISFDDSVRELIAQKGFDKKSGAREARRVTEKLVDDTFAENFICGKISAGDKIICRAENGDVVYEKKSLVPMVKV